MNNQEFGASLQLGSLQGELHTHWEEKRRLSFSKVWGLSPVSPPEVDFIVETRQVRQVLKSSRESRATRQGSHPYHGSLLGEDPGLHLTGNSQKGIRRVLTNLFMAK